MTENKSLKRRVRERMSKTGERYASARHNLLASSQSQSVRAEEAIPPELPAETGPSDEVLAQRTGRSWQAWIAELDAWGAAEQPHAKIARWLSDAHGVDGWWAQALTVRYEKHIGRRVLGQRGDTFAAGASRTIGASPERTFEAFFDPALRSRWLPDVELAVRTSTSPKGVRFNVGDGSQRLVVTIDPKGEGRATVHVEHERLADAATALQMKALWRERLGALKALLEG